MLKLLDGILFYELALGIALSEDSVEFHSIPNTLIRDELFDLVHKLLDLPLYSRFTLSEVYQRGSHPRPIPRILTFITLSMPPNRGGVADVTLRILLDYFIDFQRFILVRDVHF